MHLKTVASELHWQVNIIWTSLQIATLHEHHLNRLKLLPRFFFNLWVRSQTCRLPTFQQGQWVSPKGFTIYFTSLSSQTFNFPARQPGGPVRQIGVRWHTSVPRCDLLQSFQGHGGHQNLLGHRIASWTRYQSITHSIVVCVNHNSTIHSVTPQEEWGKKREKFALINGRLSGWWIQALHNWRRQPVWEKPDWLTCRVEEDCTNPRHDSIFHTVVACVSLNEPRFLSRRSQLAGLSKLQKSPVQWEGESCLFRQRRTIGLVCRQSTLGDPTKHLTCCKLQSASQSERLMPNKLFLLNHLCNLFPTPQMQNT